MYTHFSQWKAYIHPFALHPKEPNPCFASRQKRLRPPGKRRKLDVSRVTTIGKLKRAKKGRVGLLFFESTPLSGGFKGKPKGHPPFSGTKERTQRRRCKLKGCPNRRQNKKDGKPKRETKQQ